MAHFSKKLGKLICKYIATTDMSLREIAKHLKEKDGISVSYQTISLWTTQEDKKEFAKSYNEAYKARVRNWVEERDNLSKAEVTIPTPTEIADKYKLYRDVRTAAERKAGAPPRMEADVRLVNKYLDQETKKQENAIKRRLEILTRNIGQIAAIYDKRYTSKYEVEGNVKGTQEMIVMNQYVLPEQPKDIQGEVVDE